MPTEPVLVGIGRSFSVGRLLTEPVRVADPAVASGFTYLAKGKYWDRLVSMSFKLVADGNAANRIVVVSFQDQDGRVMGQPASPFNQTATVTTQYTVAPGLNQFGANGAANIGFATPDIVLQSGWKIVVSIVGVQAGDQISLVTLLLDRFPTGAGGYNVGAYEETQPVDDIARRV